MNLPSFTLHLFSPPFEYHFISLTLLLHIQNVRNKNRDLCSDLPNQEGVRTEHADGEVTIITAKALRSEGKYVDDLKHKREDGRILMTPLFLRPSNVTSNFFIIPGITELSLLME